MPNRLEIQEGLTAERDAARELSLQHQAECRRLAIENEHLTQQLLAAREEAKRLRGLLKKCQMISERETRLDHLVILSFAKYVDAIEALRALEALAGEPTT